MSEINEIGRKAYFWYRVYVGVLAFLYLAVCVLGITLAILQPETSEYDRQTLLFISIMYATLGAIFFAISVVALLLPLKPYNWIIGFVMIAIGMTSCCFLPFTIPLLIYWIKPETKAFFGRK